MEPSLLCEIEHDLVGALDDNNFVEGSDRLISWDSKASLFFLKDAINAPGGLLTVPLYFWKVGVKSSCVIDEFNGAGGNLFLGIVILSEEARFLFMDGMDFLWLITILLAGRPFAVLTRFGSELEGDRFVLDEGGSGMLLVETGSIGSFGILEDLGSSNWGLWFGCDAPIFGLGSGFLAID